MQWAEVLADRSLKDLPYKIELDKWGNVVMSPASNRHGRLQGVLFAMLEKLPGGRALIECSVASYEGVKVADVAWCSDAFFDRHGYETPYPRAPEICVEVRSPANSEEELHFKTRLYLGAGAREVWIVLETGEARFFGAEGERAQSEYGLDPRPLLNH
ncbi:MAG: Uma2 family endonuclease [Pseudomonadota bacterium]|nr:Uma2 family endonuclease [Pseudomonadota bacterium]MDP1903930.1 Uma2 family endonuclease [Pseudomonadota bacterium]MDP2351673.1 Uma2 family endonuclease [Pseudomonadota bacterium]